MKKNHLHTTFTNNNASKNQFFRFPIIKDSRLSKNNLFVLARLYYLADCKNSDTVRVKLKTLAKSCGIRYKNEGYMSRLIDQLVSWAWCVKSSPITL